MGKQVLTKIFAGLAAGLFFGFFVVVGCTNEKQKVYFEVSEETATLYGYVKDVGGKPIEGAKISVYPLGAEVQTDSKGFYKLSINIESLPRDAILLARVKVQVEKEGYVTSARDVPLAEYKEHATGITAVIQRLREENFILAKPAKIEISVINKEGDAVPGAEVRIFPSAGIAFYLGVSQDEVIASVTSATAPVEITQGIPAIPFESVSLAAFPPKGKESEFSVGFANAGDLGEGWDRVKIVLGVEKLRVLYTSVDAGQYISPNSDIKVIFSKEITGVIVDDVQCNGQRYQIYVKIDGAVVEIKPAGTLLGNCFIIIGSAYGKDGEIFYGYSADFVAFDPSAPRGLACPKPEINLKAYGDNVTAVAFSSSVIPPPVVVTLEPGNFSTPAMGFSGDLNLIWSPLVLPGIIEYKVYKLDIVQAELGRVIWEYVNVTPQFRPIDKKWIVTLPVGNVDISFGRGVSFAVVPVNVNGEEVCSLENAPYISFVDNMGPLISGISKDIGPARDYDPSSWTFRIFFSEAITSGQISVSSRTFNITPISQMLVGNTSIRVEFFAEPISLQIPSGIADNDNSSVNDKTLTFSSAPAILWFFEEVDVYDSSGANVSINNPVTAVVRDGNNWKVWFRSNLGSSNFQNGWIEPDKSNFLQSPWGKLYVDAGNVLVVDFVGLAVGDRIEVANVGGGSLKLTVDEFWWEGGPNVKVKVREDVSGLRCKRSELRCDFRSFRPDIVFKAEGVKDTSGNSVVEFADQVDSSGQIKW